MRKKLIRFLSRLLRVKYSISLSEFHDAIGIVAAEQNENYYCASVEMNPNKEINFKGYINNNTWVSGLSVKEVCDGLTEYHKGKKVKEPLVDDVIIHP